jgi:hypothetical protein
MPAVPEPLHTRMMSVRLLPESPDTFVAEGQVLDVRKRGIVTVAGRVNGPGLVHDMRVRLVIERETLAIRDASLAMPAVPFPSTPLTAGESCRDNEPAFRDVIGLRLASTFTPGLHRLIGGRRGCFHVFTLMRLLGPSIEGAARRHFERSAGRAFSRTIVVDGFRTSTGLALSGVLVDLDYADPSPERATATFEARAEAEVRVPAMTVESLLADYRRDARDAAAWTSEGLAAVERLSGSSLLRGFSLDLVRYLPDAEPPVRELLLMLQPVAFQCMPAFAGDRAVRPERHGEPIAATDSCRMWRKDGPLLAHVASRPR